MISGLQTEDYLADLPQYNELIEKFNSKIVFVTGGAGAIGSNLVEALSILVGQNGKVIVLDNLSASKTGSLWTLKNKSNVLFVKGDIRDTQVVNRCMRERPSIVFHLAAFFANQNSVDYPGESASVDVLGHLNLLDSCVLSGVDRFVYASSGCAIYGSFPELPVKEDFVSMHLTTPYQINKMVGEMYNNYHFHHYGLAIVNCRFFNSYGPGEVPGQYRNVIPNFLYWGMKNIPLPITGDGHETRDFTYALDLVQGLLLSAINEAAVGQNFNLAAGKEISIKDMANKVLSATGSTAGIEYKPRRKWDTKPRLLASIEKANKLIGYEPRIDFSLGFDESVKWFRENWANIEADADFNPGMSSAIR